MKTIREWLKELQGGRDKLFALKEQMHQRLESVRAAEPDAARAYERKRQNTDDLEAYLDDPRRKQRVIDAIKAKFAAERMSALRDARHEMRTLREELRAQAKAFKAVARRAPDAETAWRTRTKEPGVSADVHINLQILDELRRARLAQTRWPEQRWQQLYEEAIADPTFQAHVTLIDFVETQVDADSGWPGAGGHQLRELVKRTQDARIPADVATVDAAIEEVGKVLAIADRVLDSPAMPAGTGTAA